jgi:phenylacetate-CoA ligase
MNYGSSQQRDFYFRLPFAVKNLAATAYGFGQRSARYGEHYCRHLAFLETSQGMSRDKLQRFQDEHVYEFVASAIRDVPYYRERNEYRDFLNHRAVSRLPVMGKKTVREHADAIRHPKWRQMQSRSAHTSGTSGQALHFPVSLDCFQREYAFRALHFAWSGSKVPGERVAFCQGHPVAHYDRPQPPFWVRDRANDFLMLSSYHLSPHNLLAYAEEIDRFQPQVICGYPSSVYLLAHAYKAHGSGRLKPRAAYTTSETLFDFQRRTIEESFGCKVFDWYGNSEMCANIVECEAGERHLKLEHSRVEILDENDQPVSPGETGRLVCTGFGNLAFPLIRYDIGDMVTLSETQLSKCGRGGILIDQVLGRVEDYVLAADGRLVGRLDHLFKDSLNVVEAQVLQREAGVVILRLVKNRAYGRSDESAIREEAALRLGSDTVVQFEYVDALPRAANGKIRFVDSSLRQSDLLRDVSLDA